MSHQKGFTLMEIVVAMVILGILAAIAVPSYLSFMNQGATNAAINNLKTIYGAEKNYYFSNGTYYFEPDLQSGLPDTPGINTHLALNITDNYSYYFCEHGFLPIQSNPPANQVICVAQNKSDGNIYVMISLNYPLATSGNSPNPQCQVDASSTCPS